jgi:hypothetical protein
VVTLAERTPPERDRAIDLLRVLSIGVVVLGHWLMATVTVGADGAVSVGNALGTAAALPYLTWALQVVPVFFLVGGFAHARALRRPTPYAAFVRGRLARLLRPVTVFVAVWTVLAAVAGATGRDEGVVAVALRTVPQPLWFLGVYLGVVALAPAMLRAHRRWGAAVPVVLGLGAVAVDAVRFAADVPAAGALNLAFVWLAVHQLGFLLSDGPPRRAGAALACGGFGALVLLTAYGPYPTSMVGLPGEPVSNVGPPTVALLAQAVMLTGLVALVRPALARLCANPRVWTVVVVANSAVMTVFLWHLTALFALTAATLRLQPDAGSPAWWATRPLWIAGCALLLAPLVAVFRAAERPRAVDRAGRAAGRPGDAVGGAAGRSGGPVGGAAGRSGGPVGGAAGRSGGPVGGAAGRPRSAVAGAASAWRAGLGMAACTVGVLGLSATGLSGLLAGHTATLVVLPLTAPAAVALVALGGLALRAPRR